MISQAAEFIPRRQGTNKTNRYLFVIFTKI